MPCLSKALKVALHCTHAGLVYTVMLIWKPLLCGGTCNDLATTSVLGSAVRQAPRFPSCGCRGRMTCLRHLQADSGTMTLPAGVVILGSAGPRNTTPSG